MQEKIFSTEWLGRTLTIKTGKLAKQATAAVTVQYGDTSVLATVVQSKSERDIDFFPLMVDFEERLYAAGIIKGSRWIKREGRPSDEAVLTGRMIDRSIRPLFTEPTRKDIQVIVSVLSADGANDFDIVSLVAASAVLSISGLAWDGPIGGIRVGRVDGSFVYNPTYEERAKSDLDLIVAGTEKKVIMIEAGANEVKENEMTAAIKAGLKEMRAVVELIKELKGSVAKEKKEENIKLISEEEKNAEIGMEETLTTAREWLKGNIKKILFDKVYYTKGERKSAVEAIKEGLDLYLFEQGVGKDKRKTAISQLVEELVEEEVTNAILKEKKRVDGRALNEVRTLEAEAGVLPRIHGSGLFTRGETQVLSVVTLGAPGMEQSLEGIEGVGKKRFMLHYNFPPFSVGEAKPMRGVGRREIGHGALAEKALSQMIPGKEAFPYTIRVVSETLGSNGSSSMASTCSASLALMEAGVPIKKAVAGIAMGLASNKDMSEWEILTDIQDLEDGQGGMDFKITGTADGITAIQLDTKTAGLTEEIIEKTLKRGLEARLQILDVMNKTIAEPRPDLSPYAPRIVSFMIDPEQIRDVIGTGGKIINKIIDATGVSIDIEDDGSVFVCGTDAAKVQEAVAWIQNIVKKFQAGDVVTGSVVRILDFGAFVELSPGKDGMVHVSKMAPYRVGHPSDLLTVGDTVTVKVEEIDDQGRVNLTMAGMPENEHFWKDEKGKSNGSFSPRGNNDRGGDRDFGGSRNRRRY